MFMNTSYDVFVFKMLVICLRMIKLQFAVGVEDHINCHALDEQYHSRSGSTQHDPAEQFPALLTKGSEHSSFQCQHGNCGRGQRDGFGCRIDRAFVLAVSNCIDDRHRQRRKRIGSHGNGGDFVMPEGAALPDNVKNDHRKSEVH